MKRLIISIFVSSTFLLAFAGCGNSNEEESTTTEGTTTETAESTTTEDTTNESSDGETVTLDFWFDWGDSGGEALEEASATYAAETGVEINTLFVAGDSITDKIISSVSAGDPPDVVLFDRFMTCQWADQGLLTDLTPYLEELGLDMTQFYAFAVEEATYEGKYYAVPFSTDSRALYYNKDMFEAAGLDPEKPPTTIEELDACAEALTIYDEDGRITQFGFIPWYNEGWLYTWGWAFGGDFYDEETGMVTPTDDEIVAALEWMYTYAEKYGAETIQSATDAGSQSDMNLFVAEKLAMIVNTPGLMISLEETNPDLNYGVTYIPTPTGTDYTTWSGGHCFIVPTGSNNPYEACEFIQYMTTGQGAVTLCEGSTSFSVSPEINEQLQWPDQYEHSQFFIDSFAISQCRPVMSEGQLYWDELSNATNDTLFGEGTAEENLQEVEETVNSELQASE